MLGRAWAWRQADGCPTAAPGVPPTPLSVLGTVHRPWMFVGPQGPRVFLDPLGQTSARREYSSEAAQNNERLRFSWAKSYQKRLIISFLVVRWRIFVDS